MAAASEAGEARLRIFSYLPKPRVWKTTITTRLCDVQVEVRGASPVELPLWLWDFDARRLERLQRTKLQAHGWRCVLAADAHDEYPRAFGHYERSCRHPSFAPDVGPYLAELEEKLHA